MLGLSPLTARLKPPYEASLRAEEQVRSKLAGTIAAAVAAICCLQSILLLLHHYGVFPQEALRTLERVPLLALACTASGVLAIVARRHFLRAPGSGATVLLSLGLAVITAFAVPSSMVSLAVPQVIWVPTIVATLTCHIRWIPLVTAVSYGVLLLRHPGAAALSSPFAWVTAAGMTWLLWMIRRLHDAGLEAAERAHARELDARFHDALTGLPNRQAFMAQLAVSRAQSNGRPLALLRLDLEQFGVLSHALGRDAGDDVLQDVARRVRETVTQVAHAARIGADDFLLLLPDADASKAEAVAAQLVAKLEAPREVAGRSVRLTPRVGVVLLLTNEPLDGEEVLKRAERAVADARRGGRRRLALAEMSPAQDRVDRTFHLGQALHGALERRELRLVYQPIACLRTGRWVKAEALLRWTSPALGAVSPGEFIPLAEANGTIHSIGDWVLSEAAQQTMRWRRAGAAGFGVSVNRSPVQFASDAETGALAPCLEILRGLGIPADCVSLEITEGVLLDVDEHTRERFRTLREAGIALALDDFGTGYASMAQLHSFDMDLVKIDRRFVSGLAPESRERVLCESVIRMAHALGIKVVAEGIETEEQEQILKDLGCDYGQGWLLGYPIPAAEFGELLSAQQSAASTASAGEAGVSEA